MKYQNSFRFVSLLVLAAFMCPKSIFGESLFDVNRLMNPLARAEISRSLGQQKLELQQEQRRLPPRNTPEIAARRDDLSSAVSSVSAAQQALDGSTPQTLRALAEVQETIRAAKNPVWVLCSGTPWTSSNLANWKSYIDPVARNLTGIARSVGVFTQYTKLANGTLQYRGVGATAFVISRTQILTNKHVLASYAYQDAAGWHFYSNQVLKLMFPLEYQNCPGRTITREVEISRIDFVGSSQSDDFAVLSISDGSLPPAVPISNGFTLAGGARVVAIGYPEHPDSCDKDSEPTPSQPCTFLTPPQVDLLFGAPDKSTPFPAERMSPGSIIYNPTPAPNAFSYDSSTWGGNSGSPVVSLVDGTVVGLHYQGLGGDQPDRGYNNAIVISRVLSQIQLAR